MEAAHPTIAAPAAASPARDFLASQALALIPGILAREDRNPHSPTYGCFDRDYWHHRSIDFPSGSAPEAVLPLALAWALPLPGNAFHHRPELAQCIGAGIHYAARSTHKDGSCDESSPFERSTAAASASLLGCMEAYRLLGLSDAESLQFFTRRADWLAAHKPRDPSAADLALTTLALQKAGHLLDTDRWHQSAANHTQRLLRMQDKEGWFMRNRGIDAHDLTLILGLIAQLHHQSPTAEFRSALTRGIEFAANLVRPDGSFAMGHTSAPAPEFHPHGFEIAGSWLPEALEINDLVLDGIRHGSSHCHTDFPQLVRRCWSFLLAWQHWVKDRPAVLPRPAGRQYFKNAGLLIDRRDGCELHLCVKWGGAFGFWRHGKPVAADSNFSVQMQKRATCITANAIHPGRHDVQLEGHTIIIRGRLRITDHNRMSTTGLVLRRMVMCSLGRLLPNMPSLGNKRRNSTLAGTPFRFTRKLSWEDGRLHITDELLARKGWQKVRSVAIACSLTGDCPDEVGATALAHLQQWIDLTNQVHELSPDAPLRIERVF